MTMQIPLILGTIVLSLAAAACASNRTPATSVILTQEATASPHVNVGEAASAIAPPACYQAHEDACNCGEFRTQHEAQQFHDALDPDDTNKLDSDGNGAVCESLR